jgi:glycosyltransferase involved in cell wall biosynthesis
MTGSDIKGDGRAGAGRLPTVSVVMPCYNAGRYVAAALRSVLAQTLAPAEIIVVDNGSTDGSPEIVAGFGPAVRLLREERRGASRARIAGAAVATGEALMFLDADDLIAPDTLAALAAALARHPDAVAICPWQRLEWAGDEAGSETRDEPAPGPAAGCWLPAPPSCERRRPGDDDLAAWLSGWWHPPCSVLWSRAAYRRSGGYDPEIPVNNDGDVMMRGFVAGNRLVKAAGGTGFYRRLPGEITVSGRRHSRAGVASRLRVLGRIERLLAARGRHGAHAAPLAEAYRRVAQDGAAPYPDLAETCAAAVARLTGPREGRAPEERAGEEWAGEESAAGDHAADDRAATAASPDPDPTTATPAPSSPPPAPASVRGLPLVSVVIPTYNRAGLVMRAIGSVLAQDYPAMEVIVIDDASTDDTAARVAGLGDPRLRLLRQDANGGVARARNRGMDAARGGLIAFLDSDDEWLPGGLAPRVARLRAAPPRTALVHGGVEVLGPGGARSYLPPRATGRVFAAMLARNVLPGFAFHGLMRREVVETIGGFDPSLPAVEDWDFLIRATRFFDVAAVDAPVCRYHNDDAGVGIAGGGGAADEVGERRSRKFEANMAARRMLHLRYRQDMRAEGVEAAFLKDSARRSLAGGLRGRVSATEAILRALRRQPARLDLYVWLASIGLPAALARPLRQHFAADMPEIG